MDDKELSLEERNLKRLLQTAYGSQVRPDPAARANTLRRLAVVLKPGSIPAEFPEKALGLLTLLLVLAGLWAVFWIAGGAAVEENDLVMVGLPLFVLANLLLTPVAGIVIVARRRKNG